MRQPAAFTGVVGLKPTYGRVSRYGLVAFASSLDQIGPIARTTEDAAAILSLIAGRDPADATSADVPTEDYAAACRTGVAGRRVAIPTDAFGEGVDPDVAEAVMRAARALTAAGASMSEATLPHARFAIPAYYVLASSEAASNLSRFDGVRYGRRAADTADLADLYRRSRGDGFGPEVRRRILLGTHALSAGLYDAYYHRASRVRTLIRRDYDAAFRSAELILTPTAPTPAFRLGEKAADPLSMYLSDILTVGANLAGLPAVTVPCGFVRRDGVDLPVGAQLTAPAFQEASLLGAAAAIEAGLGLGVRRPPAGAPA